jgi:L-arabinose isomerase
VKTIDRRPNVGLVPATLDLFWDLYPELQARSEVTLEGIVERLRQKVDLVSPGLIGNADEAAKAGMVLSEAGVDLAVVWESGYVTAEVPMQALGHLGDLPVLLFVTQRDAQVPPEMDYVRYMESTALTGLVELGGSLSKTGRQFVTVVGQNEEDTAYEKVARFARVAMIVSELKNLNIGMVGHVFPGMMDITVDETSVNLLGPTITHIPLAEIEARVKSAEKERVKEAIEAVKAAFGTAQVQDDDLFRATRLWVVLQDLVDDYGINGFSLLCQHYVDVAADAPPCLALSMLQQTSGIMNGCEGDLGNAIGAFVLRGLSGQSPLFVDWTMFDETQNALFFQHCGIADPTSVSCPTLSPHSENFGFSGDGVAVQAAGKPGAVTMVSLMHGRDGWRVFASEGEALPFDARPCRLNQVFVRVEQPVKAYLEAVSDLGLPHHLNVGYGHVADDIQQLAALLGMEYLTV